jgi:predicted nicotinamide N-methyase
MEHVSKQGELNKRKPLHEEEILYFQDFFQRKEGTCNGTEINTDNSPLSIRRSKMDSSEIFFELANAPTVGFKIESHGRKKNKKKGCSSSSDNKTPAILIKQDNTCQSHTGGIVWETAYLLACYLHAKYQHDNNHSSTRTSTNENNKRKPLGKTLEVGSGCGMLGLVLAASGLCKKVVMTETQDVMANLIKNVEFNTTLPNKACSSKKISVRQLRWDAYKEDIQHCQSDVGADTNTKTGSTDLDPHTFDTIIGTDVIFSTQLVKPLLKTLRKMSDVQTNIYLCVQVRCADSHSLFLEKASKYDFICTDRTEDLREFPSCSFGLDLECKLLHLALITNNSNTTSNKRKTNNSEKRSSKRTKE